MMIRWTKPNGSTIETNELTATTEYAKSLGWSKSTESGDAPKRTRRTKAEMRAAREEAND